MSLAREVGRAIRSTLVLWLIVAIIYPLAMIGFAQIAFPYQANGSLIKNKEGKLVGSALIGQPFNSERYFNGRPSSVDYSTNKKIGISGGSNLAPSNPELLTTIQKKIESLKQSQITPSASLVYSSGSGLDPHLTPKETIAQIPRVAKARGLQPSQLEKIILKNTDGRFLGIFGEPGVNILKLNLALDQL